MSTNITRGLFITPQETIRDADPDSPIDSTQQKRLCNFNTVQQFYKSHICETTR
jgi:hypothetical protein